MGKAFKFALSVALTCAVLGGIVWAVWLLDARMGFLSVPRREFGDEIRLIERTMFRNVAAGVTVGAIVLACAVFVIPLFMKKVDRRSYVKNVVLGMVSTAVFWLSQTAYSYFEKVGGIIQVAAIAGLVFAGAVLVEFFALVIPSRDDGGEFRTIVLAGVTSGLLFSLALSVTLAALKAV